MLINNSRAETYFEDLQMCDGFLDSRGYGRVIAPSDLDEQRRQSFLSKFRDRKTVDRRTCEANPATLVVPYFPGVRSVQLCKRLVSLSKSFPSVRFRVAYTNCANSFLKTYPLNFERG